VQPSPDLVGFVVLILFDSAGRYHVALQYFTRGIWDGSRKLASLVSSNAQNAQETVTSDSRQTPLNEFVLRHHCSVIPITVWNAFLWFS